MRTFPSSFKNQTDTFAHSPEQNNKLLTRQPQIVYLFSSEPTGKAPGAPSGRWECTVIDHLIVLVLGTPLVSGPLPPQVCPRLPSRLPTQPTNPAAPISSTHSSVSETPTALLIAMLVNLLPPDLCTLCPAYSLIFKHRFLKLAGWVVRAGTINEEWRRWRGVEVVEGVL